MPKKANPERPLTARQKAVFYTKVLDEAEKADFETAAELNDIDNEITLMRVILKRILEKDPDNSRLIIAAADSLARLIRIRSNIAKDHKPEVSVDIGDVLKNLAVPLTEAVLGKKW